MDADELLQSIRATRTKQDIVLKPSPYLRESYLDEYGEEREVKIRNYQAQGILNMLQMERMVLGDDTGLGKTLVMLSTIGYVWMVEPEYVPIIVTTKSALFQWAGEIRKFMKGMDAVTVSGEPFKRHALYEDFFLGHDPARKRVLVITYDHVMYDMAESVIKEKSKSPRKSFSKELKAAREEKKESAVASMAAKDTFDARFGSRTFDIAHYVEESLREGATGLKEPPGWEDEDAHTLKAFVTARDRLMAATSVVDSLNREAAPPKRVPGLIDYVREFRLAHPSAKVMLAMDEVHKLKNHRSQFHEKTGLLAGEAQRLYGMTATPVKNKLMEFFSLFRIIRPGLFPKITHFQNEYCVTKLQAIGGGRQVPIVVGYKNLDAFVRKIEPFYLSRKKYDVAKELPELLSREVECELYDLQEELYDMAETGLLSDSDDPDSSNADLLRSMTMCQQAVNSPKLIADEEGSPYDGPSSKADELMGLLEDEADGQKVIVFSKFEKMISVVDAMLKEKKIPFVRITGKESDPKYREKVKNQFQDMKSGVNVILITTAGSESINLHSAQHFVFLDLPWSAGDYLQLIGRMIRIGSSHETVVAHHFLGRKKDGGKTIDHRVLKALRSKKKLMDKVAGDGLKGAFVFTGNDDTLSSIIEAMRADKLNMDVEKRKPGKRKPGTKKLNPGLSVRKPVEDDHPVIHTLDSQDILKFL